MRFLADENVHSGTVAALRAEGHDVIGVSTDAPGSSDTAVLAMANLLGRTLITNDTDFGELIFHRNFPAESGVILLRLPGTVNDHTARLIDALAGRDDWNHYFTTVTEHRVRRRPLPST